MSINTKPYGLGAGAVLAAPRTSAGFLAGSWAGSRLDPEHLGRLFLPGLLGAGVLGPRSDGDGALRAHGAGILAGAAADAEILVDLRQAEVVAERHGVHRLGRAMLGTRGAVGAVGLGHLQGLGGQRLQP